MLDVVSLVLTFIAVLSGMWIIMSHGSRWNFCCKDILTNKEALIYSVVALSTAACLGQFFILLSSTFEHATAQQLTAAIQRVIGSISICGFHLLATKSLEEN